MTVCVDIRGDRAVVVIADANMRRHGLEPGQVRQAQIAVAVGPVQEIGGKCHCLGMRMSEIARGGSWRAGRPSMTWRGLLRGRTVSCRRVASAQFLVFETAGGVEDMADLAGWISCREAARSPG